MVVHNDAPLNCEPPLAALAGEITATDGFYCRNHGPIPQISPADWRLTVAGPGTGPQPLGYQQVTELPAHELTATLVCAGNRRAELMGVRPMPGKEPWRQGAISTATWRGARLADVLVAAGVGGAPDAHVAFTGVDVAPEAAPPQPYGSSIPLAKAMAGEVLLAWAMNDEPLPRVHGGPIRVIAPGFIGARSVKWVTGITVQPGPSANYFQNVEYRLLPPDAEPAPGAGTPLSSLPLNCAVLTPGDGATVPAGPLDVTGYAVAEDCARIAAVEVSADGGDSWRRAALTPAHGRWSWRHWSLSINAEPGPLRLIARAVDDTGATQPESAAALWNPGGYANNSWTRLNLRVA